MASASRAGGRRLGGGEIDSHGDHRIAMAFTMASLLADAAIRIRDIENVGTSFPGFVASGLRPAAWIMARRHDHRWSRRCRSIDHRRSKRIRQGHHQPAGRLAAGLAPAGQRRAVPPGGAGGPEGRPGCHRRGRPCRSWLPACRSVSGPTSWATSRSAGYAGGRRHRGHPDRGGRAGGLPGGRLAQRAGRPAAAPAGTSPSPRAWWPTGGTWARWFSRQAPAENLPHRQRRRTGPKAS